MKRLIVTDGVLWGVIAGVVTGALTNNNPVPFILLWMIFGAFAGMLWIMFWEMMIGAVE